MLLRANVLLRPTSGVRPELVDALVAMLNAGVVPRVPEQGSVGASGDLAPLSHIALALMGEGEVLAGQGSAPAAAALHAARHSRPIALRPRKASPSSTAPRRRRRCWRSWCTTRESSGAPPPAAAAMSLEAPRGTPAPLDPSIHAARPHRGQIEAADLMRALLGRQRDQGVAPRGRSASAGRLQPALRTPGARGGERRDPLCRGDGRRWS